MSLPTGSKPCSVARPSATWSIAVPGRACWSRPPISPPDALRVHAEQFALICSDLESVPLSFAVAASSAVPILLSPVTAMLNEVQGIEQSQRLLDDCRCRLIQLFTAIPTPSWSRRYASINWHPISR